MALSKRLRYEVLRRDSHTCRYCGSSAPDVKLTVDHVVPTALGGSDDPTNLVAACADCNAGKSSSNPDASIVEDVAADALRWAEALKRAAEIERGQKETFRPTVEAVDERWCDWHIEINGEKQPLPRPSDWQTTIESFAQSGLSETELVEAVEVTMGARGVYNRNLWRYFCGVCRQKLRNRQAVARALLEAEAA